MSEVSDNELWVSKRWSRGEHLIDTLLLPLCVCLCAQVCSLAHSRAYNIHTYSQPYPMNFYQFSGSFWTDLIEMGRFCLSKMMVISQQYYSSLFFVLPWTQFRYLLSKNCYSIKVFHLRMHKPFHLKKGKWALKSLLACRHDI